MVHFIDLEYGIIGSDCYVGYRSQGTAKTNSLAAYFCDYRDFAITDRSIAIENDIGIAAPVQSVVAGGGNTTMAGAAAAEYITGTGQHHDTGFFMRRIHDLCYLHRHVIGGCITVIWSVQGYGQNFVVNRCQYITHCVVSLLPGVSLIVFFGLFAIPQCITLMQFRCAEHCGPVARWNRHLQCFPVPDDGECDVCACYALSLNQPVKAGKGGHLMSCDFVDNVAIV